MQATVNATGRGFVLHRYQLSAVCLAMARERSYARIGLLDSAAARERDSFHPERDTTYGREDTVDSPYPVSDSSGSGFSATEAPRARALLRWRQEMSDGG